MTERGKLLEANAFLKDAAISIQSADKLLADTRNSDVLRGLVMGSLLILAEAGELLETHTRTLSDRWTGT